MSEPAGRAPVVRRRLVWRGRLLRPSSFHHTCLLRPDLLASSRLLASTIYARSRTRSSKEDLQPAEKFWSG